MMAKNSVTNLLVCLIFIFCISISSGYAQYADCTPNSSTTDPEGVGVRDPIDLPVGFNGDYYNTVLTIISPAKATTWGFINFTITKIQLTELVNMPEGLTWESNSGNSDDYLYAGEKYCIVVEGTPNSTPGIRKIDVYANAWIRVLFETSAPGNPRNGGDVTFTLCNELNLNLGNDISITTNDEVTLNANQNDNYHTYLWSNNSTNPTYLVKGSDLGVGVHDISVTVTDTVGTTGIYSDREPVCFKTDNIRITVTQGASAEQETANNFSVFPNPSNGKIFISLNDFKESVALEVRDINGNLVFGSVLSQQDSEIDLSALSKGLYYVSITDRPDIKPEKIILN
jgi:hypothetical protein